MSRWSQVIGGHLKPQSELPVVTFDDISGHWAKEMFEELASQGMITGYPDGSFHPNESIKRQHMALLLMRAFEIEPVREAVSFSDVPPSHPNYEAIMSLQQAGIVVGSNGSFNPNHLLTRAEMAKILTLALEIEPGGTVAFQDVPTMHWSYDYMAALTELKIVLGDNGKFKPDEPVTRAQFVAMMYRALNACENILLQTLVETIP
ncbi:S-layer homology domain-containing protein [Paenibacillus taichungensis]|uniref:S-layer homology domain-containing protein n=1 Tax=Paenibacillus taichungensis TaxID=484184 RepID=UPI00382C3EED